jgi:hypothetical protein
MHEPGMNPEPRLDDFLDAEDGHAYGWGGGGLLVVILIVILLIWLL